MNLETLAGELNNLLTIERRSLVHHLDEAKPYLTAKTFRIWSEIGRLAQSSQEHAGRLSALLDRFELPERPTSYSSQVARFHYLTVESLLPRIINEKQRQITAYHRVIEHAGNEQAVRAVLEALLADNRDQLDRLRVLEANLAGDEVVAG